MSGNISGIFRNRNQKLLSLRVHMWAKQSITIILFYCTSFFSSLSAADNLTLPFWLQTPSDVVALQFDVSVTESSITLSDPSLEAGAVSHTIQFADIDTAKKRYLIYSRDGHSLTTGRFLGVALNMNQSTNLGDVQVTISSPEFSDADGNSVSAQVLTPPIVVIERPKSSRGFRNTDDVKLVADAADPDGTVSKVEFFIDETKIAETTSAPHQTNWTPDANGRYTLTAVATDDNGLTNTTTEKQIQIFSLNQLSTFQEFKNLYFRGETNIPSMTDPMVDPDNDGIINFLEYFLNLDPFEPDSKSLPVPKIIDEGNNRYLVYRFTKLTAPFNVTPPDVIFNVQKSTDLANWKNVSPIQMKFFSNNDGTEDVEVKIPLLEQNDSQSFIRINVQQN